MQQINMQGRFVKPVATSSMEETPGQTGQRRHDGRWHTGEVDYSILRSRVQATQALHRSNGQFKACKVIFRVQATLPFLAAAASSQQAY